MYIKIIYNTTTPYIRINYETTPIYIKQNLSNVYVRVTGDGGTGSTIAFLSQLEDVSALSPSDGDVLQYVSSTNLWTKTSSIDFGSW